MELEIKKEKLFWLKINGKEYTVYTDGSIEYPEEKNDRIFVLNMFPAILFDYLSSYSSKFQADLSPSNKPTESLDGGEQTSAL